MWEPHVGYPDPAVQVLHPSFERYRIVLAAVERLATGFRFTEGPVWFGDHRCLLFSDIPNNRIMRWDEQTGAVSVFRTPSNFTNGNARDREGRLVSCEHGTRRVTRTEHNGGIAVLADSYEGKPLNSPNDVVVKSDGTIWFTDPAFGISSDYEGNRAEPELPTNLYRFDPRSGRFRWPRMTSSRQTAWRFRPMRSNSMSCRVAQRPTATSWYTTSLMTVRGLTTSVC